MNCGTPRGWDDHKRSNTPPCKWCIKAVESPAPPPKPKPAPKPRKSRSTGVGRGGKPLPREHGTERGYNQHRKHKDPICDPCREAMITAQRERWQRRKARERGQTEYTDARKKTAA